MLIEVGRVDNIVEIEELVQNIRIMVRYNIRRV